MVLVNENMLIGMKKEKRSETDDRLQSDRIDNLIYENTVFQIITFSFSDFGLSSQIF